MKITIESNAILKNKTCIGEVLVLLEILNKVNHAQVIKSLIDKGYITSCTGQLFATEKTYAVTVKGAALLEDVNLESSDSKEEPQTRDYRTLASSLKELFPKGRKQGTSQQWTEGIDLIIKRLKIFFKKYPSAESYSNEEILEAASRYMKSFNGDYHYMRILKYFIWGEKRNDAGEVESTSDLLTYLENASQKDETGEWNLEMR